MLLSNGFQEGQFPGLNGKLILIHKLILSLCISRVCETYLI